MVECQTPHLNPTLVIVNFVHLFKANIIRKHLTVCNKIPSCESFLANSFKSSIYRRWLICLEFVTLYPFKESNNKLKGVNEIQNSKGLRESPWWIPQLVETSVNSNGLWSGNWRNIVEPHKGKSFSTYLTIVKQLQTLYNPVMRDRIICFLVFQSSNG